MADPIAIHYSQPSMRTEWMLARRPEGENWVTRSLQGRSTDSEFPAAARIVVPPDRGRGSCNTTSFLTRQVEQGELLKGGYKLLVLPQSSSLSTAEVSAVREFISQGGIVIADGEPGAFDEHSRRLPQSPLADLFGGSHEQAITVHDFGKGKAIFLKTDTLDYHQNRLDHKEGPVHELVGNLLRSNGIRPEFAVTDAKGNPVVGVETHIYRNGGVRLITLISNPQLRVDELGPPEFRSNERFETPVTVNVSLPEPMYCVRHARSQSSRTKANADRHGESLRTDHTRGGARPAARSSRQCAFGSPPRRISSARIRSSAHARFGRCRSRRRTRSTRKTRDHLFR